MCDLTNSCVHKHRLSGCDEAHLLADRMLRRSLAISPQQLSPAAAARGPHSGAVMRSAADVAPPGHPAAEAAPKGTYEDYLHAEHMYSINQMRFRKPKVGAAVMAILGFGAGIPVFVVWWHLYRRTDIPASIPADPDQYPFPVRKARGITGWFRRHFREG